jgi:hypothetical protein
VLGSESLGKAARVSGRLAQAVRGRGRLVQQEARLWLGRVRVVRVRLER